MDDKRKSPRRRTLKAGKIIFNDGRSSIDCTVRNISASGALLLVASPVGIPEQFVLLIEAESFRRNCQVVRRASQEIGVRFNVVSSL